MAVNWLLPTWLLVWYFLALVLSVLDRKILVLCQLPITLCAARMLGSSMGGLIYHFAVGNLNVRRMAQLLPSFVTAGLCNTACIVGYCMALRASVVMTFVIKAGVPAFTATFAGVFFRIVYPFGVYMTLVPIILGILIESWTDLEFSRVGFTCALWSVSGEALMGLFLKRAITVTEVQPVVAQTLVAIASIMPLLVMLGMGNEGHIWHEEYTKVQENDTFWLFVALAVVGHHFEHVAALKVLSLCSSALSYHVFAVVRKLLLIFFSVLWYGKVLSHNNRIGIAICLWGCILFNLVNAVNAGQFEDMKKSLSKILESDEAMPKCCRADLTPKNSSSPTDMSGAMRRPTMVRVVETSSPSQTEIERRRSATRGEPKVAQHAST